MKVKESLLTKVIKRFYGISGVLDEYRRSQVEHIGNNAFILMFWYMLLSNFVAVLFAYKYPEVTVWALIGTNLFFLLNVICLYIIYTTSKIKLTENEVETKDIEKEKKKIVLNGIGSGIYFAIGIHILKAILAVSLEEGDFFESIAAPDKIITSLLGGCFFGGMMYLVLKNRLKKIDES